MYQKTFALILISFCVGCETQTTLTVSSTPEGAYITEVDTGTQFGMTPTIVTYDVLTLNKTPDGCYLVKGFTATWASGASATIQDPIKICRSPGNNTISIQRDISSPNLYKDLQIELQIQSMRAQKEQAESARFWSAWAASQENKIKCTSRPIGKSVYTNCK